MTDPFRTSPLERLKRAASADTSAAAANALFGDFVDKHPEQFRNIRENLKRADIDVLYRTYVSQMFFFSLGAFLLGILGGGAFTFLRGYSGLAALRFLLGVPTGLFLVIFGSMYLYPRSKAKRRSRDIDENLPFALNHLSAISSSGVPPDSMFELLEEFEAYGEIQKEARKVTRRVNVFGEDITTALREVAERTPSQRFSEFLYGLVSTVETGGNLKDYIDEQAEEQLFQYNIEKEKEIERISTYASFYTALLIAAPIFLVVLLSVINLLQETIGGITVRNLMFLGIHVVIPVLNSLFIIFLVFRAQR